MTAAAPDRATAGGRGRDDDFSPGSTTRSPASPRSWASLLGSFVSAPVPKRLASGHTVALAARKTPRRPGMSTFENDRYRWRETYFLLFDSTKRPAMEQVRK